ncbi:MAG: nitroreductase family protein [Candidatus Pacearchaeota archaeon]|nr:nitroreductase family protein [Candidatus Pacearchaeota archaeon]
MELDKAIQNRHSVRKFSNKKPDWRTIIECLDASRFAPMAGNIYTARFIIVDDVEKIRKIAEAAQQDFISEAKYLLVVCSAPSKTLNAYEERGKNYYKQQAGAAIQNFLLKIEEAGLATCWIGHFVEEQVKDELKIPDDITVEALFPIGYEFTKSRRKSKIDLDRILYFNSYQNKKMKNPVRGD